MTTSTLPLPFLMRFARGIPNARPSLGDAGSAGKYRPAPARTRVTKVEHETTDDD